MLIDEKYTEKDYLKIAKGNFGLGIDIYLRKNTKESKEEQIPYVKLIKNNTIIYCSICDMPQYLNGRLLNHTEITTVRDFVVKNKVFLLKYWKNEIKDNQIIDKLENINMVSESFFKEINEKYPNSSWAIWGDKVDDISVFNDENKPWKKAKTDYMILSLNPNVTKESDKGLFKNFHSSSKRHHDIRLKLAIEGTSLEGSYMCDLSVINEGNSKKVVITEKDYQVLLEKVKYLGCKAIFCLNCERAKELTKMFEGTSINVFYLLSYSGANGYVKKYCIQNNISYPNGDDGYALAVKDQLSKYKL